MHHDEFTDTVQAAVVMNNEKLRKYKNILIFSPILLVGLLLKKYAMSHVKAIIL